MIPRTLILTYPEGFKPQNTPRDYEAEELFLPTVLHLRAAKLMTCVIAVSSATPSRMVVRSEYDALREIEFELSVEGVNATVEAVRFLEA